MSFRSRIAAFMGGLFIAVSSAGAEDISPFTVAGGLAIQRAAAKVVFPMFAALGEPGDLFVAESSGKDLYAELQKLTRECRISLLRDSDGDGVYDHAEIFARQLVFPMGLAWREGKLYAADPPELVALEDTDGDRRADRRTVILSGFGHTDNGSLHGLTFGPDGWLYMTMGQPDGYRLRRADGSRLEGKSGALLRCRPDGSEVEVVARGFENLVEIVFMPSGEIIGTDNWFALPADGIRDALVHLLEGGLYPLQLQDAGTKFFRGAQPLPALKLYPAVALSGLARYQGPAFRDSLFSAQFNTRKIVRHQLQRKGSTFESADEDFLTTEDPDFHPSDVLEDRDGSLLVVDTGSWYVHHCPTGRIRNAPATGGIYRIVPSSDAKAPLPDWEREIWKDPAAALRDDGGPPDRLALAARVSGRRKDKSAEGPLRHLLGHNAPWVRLAAAEALAGCGSANSVENLVAAIETGADPHLEHALLHALFCLADAARLSGMLDGSPAAQRAALVLLDQPPHQSLTAGAVASRVLHASEPLARTARQILLRHPEWIESAIPVFRSLLHSDSAAQSLREFAVAFAAHATISVEISAAFSSRSGVSDANQIALLEAMPQMPPPRRWVQPVRQALSAANPAVRQQAVRVAAALQIAESEPELRLIASENSAEAPLRIEALRALSRLNPRLPDMGTEFLLDQAARANPPTRRLAAFEALSAASLKPAQLHELLRRIAGDPLISPSAALSLIQRTAPGSAEKPVLEYLGAALKGGWRPSEADREWIASRFPEALSAAPAAEDHAAQLARFEPLLSGGDPNRGHELFLGKLACAACHRVGKTGGLAGPDLSKIGAIRSGRDLLESVLFPSATIAQGYDAFRVTLEGSEASLAGMRARQLDDSLVIREASGAEHRLDPSRIKTMEPSPVSLMPEGLLSAATDAEIRDLFTYLRDLR